LELELHCYLDQDMVEYVKLPFMWWFPFGV